MSNNLKMIASIVLAGLLWSFVPEASMACERCFGAGADAATNRAVGGSMLVLIVLLGFMGSGIFSFFNGAHRRAAELANEGRQGQTEDFPEHDRT